MADRIIGAFVCLICSGTFFLLAYTGRIRSDPLNFWSGDEKRLKEIVKDVPSYNKALSKLYNRYAFVFLLAALLTAIYPMAGLVVLFGNITLGLYLLWKNYKAVLEKFS